MPNEAKKILRTLHVRFRLPSPDAGPQLSMMVQASAPFLAALGDTRVRLLRNADDPAQFVQVIEYEAEATMEASRQKFASDPMLRTYLQGWRSLFPGGVELDVFEDVTEGV